MQHVELKTYNSFSRLNTSFTSLQTCHMLPLDHFKQISSSGTIQDQIHFIFMNDPMTCEEWLDALNKSLAMDEWHVNQLYLALLEGEACHIMGVH
jgi:hypothetical protein